MVSLFILLVWIFLAKLRVPVEMVCAGTSRLETRAVAI